MDKLKKAIHRDRSKLLILLEAAIGIEPMNKAFAELCLTTWLRRLTFDFQPRVDNLSRHLLARGM